MFTGIIVAIGRINAIAERGGDLELGIDAVGLDTGRLGLGDSVCVQGVCLTVTRMQGTAFFADVSRETMSKSGLGSLKAGSPVNLEPSLRAGDALGGHMVSGHVDGVGRLVEADEDARSTRLTFELPQPLMKFVASKGSICIDGVSLTVNNVAERRFDVNIIPHTLKVTTLGALKVGDAVNIEIDVIARYVERLLSTSAGRATGANS
jgi:riboflavin synthase